MNRSPRTVIVGAGFGGLGVARALRLAGHDDVTVLERAAEVGGVWRDNTYPGAACDVPSPLYSWSWAPNPSWGRRYSVQPEILEYLRSTAADEGLLELVRTDTTVTGATWDEQTSSWEVRTTGATYAADLLVFATGPAGRPRRAPDLPGAEGFAGPAFHSAQWRHDVDLAGKRVAVVGTGASAIQFVPGIVDEVGAMTVFQRSAPYVVPKPDREYTPRHHRMFARLPWTLAPRTEVRLLAQRAVQRCAGRHQPRHPSGDGRDQGGLAAAPAPPGQGPRPAAQAAPDLPARLQATAVLQRLVPRPGPRPRRRRHPVASPPSSPTGAHRGRPAAPGRRDRLGHRLRGHRLPRRPRRHRDDGRSLGEVWHDGARAHLGMGVAGFPNLFTIYGPNTNLGGSSIIGMLEAQAGYVTEVADALATGRVRAVAPRAAAYDAYDREMQERLSSTAWSGCHSWYEDHGRITTNWPGRVQEYKDRTAVVDWDDLEDVAG